MVGPGANRAPVLWNSIETVPIPVGLGGQFDFSPNGTNLQAGYYSVVPGTTYNAVQSYAWTKAPPRGYTGGALAASPPPAQNVSNLWRDGVDGFAGLTNAAVFRLDLAGSNPVQVTAYLGDAFSARDGITLEYSLNGTTFTPLPGLPAGGLSYPIGQYNSFSAIVTPNTLTGGVYPLYVRIYDAGGPIGNFAISGLEVRRIDFGPATTPVAADQGGKYLGLGTGLYTSANQLGWLTAPTGTFDRGGVSDPVRDLLRDGVYATGAGNARSFEIDLPTGVSYSVTVVMGDVLSGVYRDQMQVAVTTGTGPTVSGINTPAAQVTPITFTATPDGTGKLVLTFSDLGGADPAWSLESITVRPLPATSQTAAASTGPALPPPPFQPQRLLNVALTGGSTEADGTTTATYTITGATPGSLVSLASPWGTFGADASPLYTGAQALANGTGTATFTVVFPRSAGSLPGTITATEVTGGGAGSVAFTATASAVTPNYRFDFNGGSNLGTAGWTSVRSNTLYSSASNSGYGWAAAVGDYEGRTTTFAPATVYSDGSFFRTASGVFKVAVGTGTVDVRIISYDPLSNLTQESFNVEGVGAQTYTAAANAAGGVYTFNGAKDMNGDGVVDITFNTGGNVWVVNGIDVAPTGQLPSLPQAVGFARPANAAPAALLTAEQLAPVVAEAIARLSVGATPEQVAALQRVRFQVTDLDGIGRLGEYGYGTVRIDDDGYGAGWFVDATPGDDREFGLTDAATQLRAAGGPAAGRPDLLTVVMHELAHEWGYMDKDAAAAPFDLMSETLGLGVRRLPSPAADAAPAGTTRGTGTPAVNLWVEEPARVADVPTAAPSLDAFFVAIGATDPAAVGRPAGDVQPSLFGTMLLPPKGDDAEWALHGIDIG